MKALILAAGLGSRLRPITNEIPKSMVKVNDKPILFKQIDNLLENGVKDITVIAGYKSEVMIEAINNNYEGIEIIVNDSYDKTNNMYSAYIAMNKMSGSDFLLMNADVFYDSEVLTELLKDKYQNAIVVEKNAYNEENMKVSGKDFKLNKISKQIEMEDAYGVSIDVYKFSKTGSEAFYSVVQDYIENKKELNQWTEVALDQVLRKVDFKACPLKGKWIEIDNHDDLNQAMVIFK